MPVITARQLAEFVPKISEKTAESLMRFTALDKVNEQIAVTLETRLPATKPSKSVK